jgi:excinuclease ABC subunit B
MSGRPLHPRRNSANGWPSWNGRQAAGGATPPDADPVRLEKMQQVGACSGIENYSRHIDGREPGTPPNTCWTISRRISAGDRRVHVTVPRSVACSGDPPASALVRHGFPPPQCPGQPAAACGRSSGAHRADGIPVGHPRPYELPGPDGAVEQIIRPTGLFDPRGGGPADDRSNDDLLAPEAEPPDRTAGTGPGHYLTKKMSEYLLGYISLTRDSRWQYLHTEVNTLRRVDCSANCDRGQRVLSGSTAPRGADLPECPCSAADADKGGFLRSATSQIQTNGRAARNVTVEFHMYEGHHPPSMARAIDRPSGAGPADRLQPAHALIRPPSGNDRRLTDRWHGIRRHRDLLRSPGTARPGPVGPRGPRRSPARPPAT